MLLLIANGLGFTGVIDLIGAGLSSYATSIVSSLLLVGILSLTLSSERESLSIAYTNSSFFWSIWFLVDSRVVLVKTPFGNEVKNHEIRKPIYTEAKAVVTSPKIFEKNGNQYLPVEYWGK